MNTPRFLLPLLGAAMLASAAAQETDALAREREEQTGTAITILFDNSGSMKGDKIRQAKAAFRSWLQTVPAEHKYSLITFEDNGRLNVPLGEKTRDLIADRVSKLSPNTGTPICGALRVAREQIEKRRREVTPYERHVVLIFTDGQETTDSRGADGVRADIEALRRQTVEVVGVGFHGEGDYMRGVATRFALANNEQELKQGLAKVDAELGDLDDVAVSAADLQALKTFQPPPVRAISATAAAAGAAEPASPSPGSKPRSGVPFAWIFVAVVVWFLLRRVFSPKNTR